MKLFTFSCSNITNIWAGIGAEMWAVSSAAPQVMRARQTKAKKIRIGHYGLIYCSSLEAFTTPFLFTTSPVTNLFIEVSDVWPERWMMPFGIKPLGTPRRIWSARRAAETLPFNKLKKTNLTSVFRITGTTVFNPIEIGDDDWAIILDRLGEQPNDWLFGAHTRLLEGAAPVSKMREPQADKRDRIGVVRTRQSPPGSL